MGLHKRNNIAASFVEHQVIPIEFTNAIQEGSAKLKITN